jgi:hypothetical protein
MTRYRRRRPRPSETVTSAAVSLAIGAAAAATAFYVVRLFLAREPLDGPALSPGEASPRGGPGAGRSLPDPSKRPRTGGGAGGRH